MLIVVEDFTQDATATTETSPNVASMPGSQLRVLQVSERARITTIADTPYFGASMEGSPLGSINPSYNVVAVIGYDGAPSRNMFRNAHRVMIDAVWTTSGFSAGSSNDSSPTDFPAFRPWDVNIAAGVNTTDQALASKPGKASNFFDSAALSLVAGFIVKQTANDADLRIIASDVAGGVTNFVRVDFDLSAATAGAATVGGTFTSPTAPSIVALGDSWYLCRIFYLTGTEDTLNVRFQSLTSGGSTTMVGNESWLIGPPVQMLGTVDLSTAEYPITSHDGTGPMFNVRLASAAHGEFDDVSAGWQHCATRNRLRDFPRYSFLHEYTALKSEPLVRVELWDPDNTLDRIEAGRLIVGRGATMECASFSLSIEESGEQLEADDGSIYRAQKTVRAKASITLHYNEKNLAFDDYNLLQRTLGRSRQLLIVLQEDDTRYLQDGLIYGYLDEINEVQLAGRRGGYQWGFDVVQTP